MASGGKSGKSGGSISAPNAPMLPPAPVLGANPRAMQRYQEQMADWEKRIAAIPDIGNLREQAMRKIPRPEAPTGVGAKQLMRETTMNVTNPYGTSRIVKNPDGTYSTVNELTGGAKEMFASAFGGGNNPTANALLSQAREMIDPQMAARGLPQGSEINDTALLRAAINAQIGGQQQAMALADRVGGARGPDVFGSYQLPFQAATLPWQAQVDRQNMMYANEAANARQAAANRASSKGSKMGALGNVGSAAIPYAMGGGATSKGGSSFVPGASGSGARMAWENEFFG